MYTISNNNDHREELEIKYKNTIEANPSLNRKLVSFQANKRTPFYSWFSYKEGFSSEMVKAFIQDYPKKNGIVLDPFAGSCTTLFSAKEMGFDSLGIEVLPIGEFVIKSRKAADIVNMDKFLGYTSKLKSINLLNSPVDDNYNFKHIPITEKAFPPDAEYKLNAFLKYCNESIFDENVKQLFLFACFCILEKISYTRKDGQYLRWDIRANKGKADFNKGKIYSFEEALYGQLEQIITDIRNMRIFGLDTNNDAKMNLETGSCLEILPSLKSESFDLVISSPPYCNRYDYTRTYALELVFLGIDDEGVKKLRQSLLSSTVENRDKLDYLRNIYKKNKQLDTFIMAENTFRKNKALQEILVKLEHYKDEDLLNNPNICRMVKNYFYEHSFVIYEMARVLKKGGRIYYVNDNVRYAGEAIPVDLILSEFASDAGLQVKKIYKLSNGKGNSSQQMGEHGREELRKCVYYWEK